MATVNVMFCCNDPRNGNFCGLLSAVEVDDVISLSGPICEAGIDEDLAGVDFEVDENLHRIKVEGIWFPICSGWSTWVGNWCWDAARMQVRDLVKLLNQLMRSGLWTCEEAATPLLGKWCSGHPFTVADLEPFLEKAR